MKPPCQSWYRQTLRLEHCAAVPDDYESAVAIGYTIQAVYSITLPRRPSDAVGRGQNRTWDRKLADGDKSSGGVNDSKKIRVVRDTRVPLKPGFAVGRSENGIGSTHCDKDAITVRDIVKSKGSAGTPSEPIHAVGRRDNIVTARNANERAIAISHTAQSEQSARVFRCPVNGVGGSEQDVA